MPNALSLEAFDIDLLADAAGESVSRQDYDDGYAAGLAAAEQNQAALSAELVQSIADLEFSYSEARRDILQALSPLMAQVTETLLPHCVAAGFATELSLTLEQAVASGIADALSVTVHPDQQASIAAALSDYDKAIDVHADSGLSLHAAWVAQGKQEDRLDLDTLLAKITEILNTTETAEPRMDAHG